jgi:hypothetical protein
MGGHGAPGDLQKGYETQAWLAVSNNEKATVSGRYFFIRKKDAIILKLMMYRYRKNF